MNVHSQTLHPPRVRTLGLIAALGLLAVGCDQQQPVVGTGELAGERVLLGEVTQVVIDLPFDVSIEHGAPGEIHIRGEDHLVALIAVDYDGAGLVTLETAPGVRFVQRRPVVIALPYETMERLSMYGDGAHMADDPRSVWNAE